VGDQLTHGANDDRVRVLLPGLGEHAPKLGRSGLSGRPIDLRNLESSACFVKLLLLGRR
jgi:hypothetical protein